MFPDLVLVLPRLEHHCRCATGEGCPSSVHPGTTATAAMLGRTRLVLAIILRGRLQAELDGEGYLSPFCLVQSREAPRAALTVWGLDVGSVNPQALLLKAVANSQQHPPLVTEDPFAEPPLQCPEQGLEVPLISWGLVEENLYRRPL
ncbi:unnamed protein product [Boreogadus saida]